jgi:hypothetical protein
MKTTFACILGLAALATSFSCGGSLVHADALEAESSALLTLAPDVDTSGAGNSDKLHCALYSDGADNCIVNVQLEAVDQFSAVVSETEPSAIEAAPAIQFVDAIAVVVTQSVAIAVPGADAGNHEQPEHTGSIPAPSATEPVFNPDAKATTDAFMAPAGQSADAIVVAVVQSVTVAVPGQNPGDNEEAERTGLNAAPMVPLLILEAKTTVLDHAE